jgi:hypothetical protein
LESVELYLKQMQQINLQKGLTSPEMDRGVDGCLFR